jgi:hypothetical protein
MRNNCHDLPAIRVDRHCSYCACMPSKMLQTSPNLIICTVQYISSFFNNFLWPQAWSLNPLPDVFTLWGEGGGIRTRVSLASGAAGSFHAKSATSRKWPSQNFMKFGILSYTYEKGKNPKFHISVTSGHRAVRSWNLATSRLKQKLKWL